MTDKTMTLEPCPFCGHTGPFDLWPCERLDDSGVNVIRCPMCHGAAPLAKWNTRHLSQTAERPCSLSEALNVIEHWGRRGNTLQSDDVARLRALTDKIAPAERGEAAHTCGYCGAPANKFVQPRGGEYGWGDDVSRTVYRYAPPPAAGVPDVSPRHPVVVHWRNDALKSAAEIVDRYAKHFPECTGAADDIRAMLSTTPSPAIDVAAVRDWQRDCPDYPNCPNLSCRCDPANRSNNAIGDAK